MFDLPDSKRVKRTELYSRSLPPKSPDLDSDLEARFQDQLSKFYGNEELSTPAAPQADEALNDGGALEKEEEQEQTYSFRLFSTPANPPNPLIPHIPHERPEYQRIILKSPTPPLSNPGFTTPRRSDQYYFSGPTSLERKEQYRAAAITGEEILKGLATPWPGAALPWRVTILKSNSKPTSPPQPSPPKHPHPTTTTTTITTAATKRKRSGKKRRIATRTKKAAEIARGLAKKQSRTETEAAEKEKRTRRNREKKVKRKVKEKVKKAQVGV